MLCKFIFSQNIEVIDKNDIPIIDYIEIRAKMLKNDYLKVTPSDSLISMQISNMVEKLISKAEMCDIEILYRITSKDSISEIMEYFTMKYSEITFSYIYVDA